MDGSNGSSFWTVCHSCSLQYEYPKFCKDQMVLCAHCHKPFRAIMYTTPSMAHVSQKMEQRIKRERDSKVSVFSPTASKVEVKTEPKAEVKIEPKAEVKVEQSSSRESGHVNQKRKTRKDKGVKRGKFAVHPNMIPPNKLRSALIEKSKSMIKDFTGRR